MRAAAAVFDAAAASVALVDPTTAELVYDASWGAGAREIVGVRMPAGTGIAGAVVASGEAVAVADCRGDARFASQIAAGTGYVPHTMLAVPLSRGDDHLGALSILDRRDGGGFGGEDLAKAQAFAELAVAALDAAPPSAEG